MTEPTPSFFERPSTIRAIRGALVAACVVAVLLDLTGWRHAELGVDGWPGFFAVYGFLAYVGIVTAAKALRRLVMRPEDYYDG